MSLCGIVVQYAHHAVLERSYRPQSKFVYFVFCVVTPPILLPAIARLAALIGLRMKTQNKAILGSLSAILIWCFVPAFCLILFFEFSRIRPRHSAGIFLLSSPAVGVCCNAVRDLDNLGPSLMTTLVVNCTLYIMIGRMLKKRLTRKFAALLGRE